jgi:hypothetical protein
MLLEKANVNSEKEKVASTPSTSRHRPKSFTTLFSEFKENKENNGKENYKIKERLLAFKEKKIEAYIERTAAIKERNKTERERLNAINEKNELLKEILKKTSDKV